MNDFWNERYSAVEYAYGTEPNRFFRQQLEQLKPGKILLPAEGEGRNAVFAAQQGWQVSAFDPSTEGKKKAERLAQMKNTHIDYLINTYESVQFPMARFDCIGLFFAHMHPLKRTEYHRKLISFLKPGGKLILEGFSKKQMNNTTGGPQNIDMLFSKQELQHDFKGLSNIEIEETDVFLDEGPFHQGIASVIRIAGIK